MFEIQRMNLRALCVLGVSYSVLVAASSVRGQSPGNNEKPLVYNNITDNSGAIDHDAKKAYAGKFRFIDVKQKDGFSPVALKGRFTDQSRFRDPRSMRQSAIPGKVVYTFIVTPDGRVLDPRILHSTDEVVSKYLIERISNERYFPARFHGAPVYSLHGEQWDFGGPDPRDPPRQNNDGLGIMRNRDR
jgi:Gram-negative bacterial TonB protein C-terminal